MSGSLLQPAALIQGASRIRRNSRSANTSPPPARARQITPGQQLSLEEDPLGIPLGLTFNRRGGPVLALVGMCGGAGATTLAYLTAAAAALESTQPVLLADLGGPNAGIATYAEVHNHSFTTVAEHLALGQRPLGAPFAMGEYGMRVLAGPPELDRPVEDDCALAVLEQAAAAHALTVLDCGQLARPVERVALDIATHVAWVLPATTAGLRRAGALLKALRKVVPGREILIARNDTDGKSATKAPLAELSELADQRHAPLILVPHLDDLAEAPTASVIEQAALPLQALGVLLRR